MDFIQLDLITKIITAATAAPSGDNSQPWNFVVRGNTVEFHYLPEKDNNILNYENGGTLIAIGAAIKNAELEAASLGYCSSIDYLQEGPCVATMTFKKGGHLENGDSFLQENIFKRHSNRRAYLNIPLESSIRSDILEFFSSNKYNIDAKLIESKESIKEISRALTTMEEIALGNQKLHELFFKGILWSKNENDEGNPGMYIKTLELPPPAQVLFRFLKYWNFARVLASIGFPKFVAFTNAKQNASASAFGIVTAEHTDRNTYLNIGRFIEHVWLLATAQGLSFQVVTGALFLARSMSDKKSNDIFSKYEKKRARASYDIIKKHVAKKSPIFAFRIGVSRAPTEISHRSKPDISFIK